MITYLEDSLDDEVEEMASKSNQTLRELMKRRNKVSTPQEANKSKPLVLLLPLFSFLLTLS